MGAAFSSSNALHVQTNKAFYYGGDLVEGVVALNCLNALNTTGIELEVCALPPGYLSASLCWTA